MRDEGCIQSKFFITYRVPIHKSTWPTDEVIMMNNDETYYNMLLYAAINLNYTYSVYAYNIGARGLSRLTFTCHVLD